MRTSTGTVTISGHTDPNLNGAITFHMPTLLERVQIERRIAALARPAAYDALPPDGRALVTLLATLEHVIDTAPQGFYQERDGRPLLALDHLSAADEELLWQVYAAWRVAARTFRDERVGDAEATSADAGGETHVERSETPTA